MPIQESRRVVMFAAEATPYIKVGGLADVVGILPRVLAKMGARVHLVIPAHETAGRIGFDIRPSDISPFDVLLGAEVIRAEVMQARLPESDVDVFFVGGGGFFSRPGLYDDPVSGEGYPDNLRRFTFFAKAGIELMRRLGFPVDVIHCHDSQAALVPALLRTMYLQDPFFARTGIMFTIHNLAYQGIYEKETLFQAGIGPQFFYPFSPFEYWGKVNLMKAGIETADLLTTVSPSYAQEIQSDPEFGCGLEGIVRNRADSLYGIVNGIDYGEWNPETDPFLPAHYSFENLEGKQECKARLLERMGLPKPAGRVPLIGIISRLADQKGFDLIGEAIDEIAVQDLQMVVLGTGQAKYHKMLESISARYPEKIAIKLAFDNELAHQIEAGSDMFLMPSRYEPCGLNQLYSLRYGAVPVVRSTGGLADTIVDYDLQSDCGTGFAFHEYRASEMMAALRRALSVFHDHERWQRLTARDMLQRWSWEESARKYLRLYEKMVEGKHPIRKS
jgi:starch synthase